MNAVKKAKIQGELKAMKAKIDELKNKQDVLPGLTPLEKLELDRLIKGYNYYLDMIKNESS